MSDIKQMHNGTGNNVNVERIDKAYFGVGSSDIDFSTVTFNPNYNSGGYGRVTLVDRLKECFFDKQIVCVNVYAMGGQGKTMFANIYKDKCKDLYGNIHHFSIYHGLDSGFVNEFRDLFRVKEFWLALNNFDDKQKRKYVIQELGKIPLHDNKPNLLVIDVNIHKRENVEGTFSPEFMRDFDELKGKWHVLLLSRYPFKSPGEKAGSDKCKESDDVWRLPDFENEYVEDEKKVKQWVPKSMFFDKFDEGMKPNCTDSELKDIFSQIHYHPLLINTLASYCRRHGKTDYASIKKCIEKSKEESLPDASLGHGDDYVFNVYDYLEKLIDFDEFESSECRMLLRHFILLPYEPIPVEVLNRILQYCTAKHSLKNYLNILADDMVLTTNEEEYRVYGRTIRQHCENRAINFNDKDYEGYETKSETEILEIIKKDLIPLSKLCGYQLHDMLAKTLRKKASQDKNKYDYSLFIRGIKDLFIHPKNYDLFKASFTSVFDMLYNKGGEKFTEDYEIALVNDILKQNSDIFILAAQHYYYYSDKTQMDSVYNRALEILPDFKANDTKDLEYLKSLADALHNFAGSVLENKGNYGDAIIAYKKAIGIRKTIYDISGHDAKNGYWLAFENYCAAVLCKIRMEDNTEAKNYCEAALGYSIDDDVLKFHIYRLYSQLISCFNVLRKWECRKKAQEALHNIIMDDTQDKIRPLPKMEEVCAGEFLMGCEDENAYPDEKPVHKVKVSRYQIGKYLVTQFQWDYIMGDEIPSIFRCNTQNGLGPDYPMYNVSWNECQRFIKKINKKEGISYRLPTEAEWEYAARGGHKTTEQEKKELIYSGASRDCIDKVAWYDENSNASTHKVGEMDSNALGLYDMSGNVWEWCQDWYGCYPSEIVTDPTGPASGASRVLRGGSWSHDADRCRVSYRFNFAPDYRFNFSGFRLLLSSPKEEKI